jgi:hypothetical protein
VIGEIMFLNDWDDDDFYDIQGFVVNPLYYHMKYYGKQIEEYETKILFDEGDKLQMIPKKIIRYRADQAYVHTKTYQAISSGGYYVRNDNSYEFVKADEVSQAHAVAWANEHGIYTNSYDATVAYKLFTLGRDDGIDHITLLRVLGKK